MNQHEFFEKLEQQVLVLDKMVQDVNDQIGKIKGQIVEYEFEHRDELKKESSKDNKDVFDGHTPYFGIFPDENKKQDQF